MITGALRVLVLAAALVIGVYTAVGVMDGLTLRDIVVLALALLAILIAGSLEVRHGGGR